MSNADRNIEEISELHARLIYDPNTGLFFSKRAGRVVGAKGGSGGKYLVVWIKNKRFLCHRLAWAMHYGHWIMPLAEIDHINGDKTDNRIGNLRMFSRQMQCRNVRLARSNRTGTTGVHWDHRMQCFSATINVNRKQIWLGRHNTLEEAVKARKNAEVIYGWPN